MQTEETSDWKSRIIKNDNPTVSVISLPLDFVEAIAEAQIQANKGWAPDMDGLIDLRVVECPVCSAPGMNTCWGYWKFTCGAKIFSDGEVETFCFRLPGVQS